MSSNLISDLTQINLIKGDIKNAIETKGQTVANFASYPASIENIVSSGNGVKQYNSLENMYADISNAHNGDLATVYASSQAPITATTEFQVATFPQTVVLDEALSDYVELAFQAVDESVMFDCRGQLNSSRFSMQCYTDDGDIRIEYQSQDGITYIRTRFMKNSQEVSGNEMDFGTLIKFGSRWGMSEFNPAISKFIITGALVFDGLFQYNSTNFALLSNTGLSANSESVWSGKFYGNNGIQNSNLSQVTNLTLNQLKDRVNLYSNLSNLGLKNEITDISDLFANFYAIKKFPDIDTSRIKNMSNTFYNCDGITSISMLNYNFSNVENMRDTFQGCSNLYDLSNLDTSNVVDMNRTFLSCSNLTYVSNLNMSNVKYMNATFAYCLNLTSINLDTSNVITIDGMFQSCPSIINSPELITSNVKYISTMFYNCTNLINVFNYDTSNVEQASSMFYNCTNLATVPNFNLSSAINVEGMFKACSKLTAVPNFNLSNAKVTSDMFNNCSNLTTVPNFNLSGVERTANMFQYCTNLTTVPNFNLSSVKDLRAMFASCSNLTAVPNFYISNVRYMLSMFYGCTNLVNAPSLNTATVETMALMFYNCRNLVNVPQYNTHNVNNMEVAFSHCNKLSNASIQNIINMCLNSNIYTTYKNLNPSDRYSPFNSTNITSSRYSNRLSELTAAGWKY